MSGSLNVQLVLSLINNASGPLKSLAGEMEGLGKAAEGVGKTVEGAAKGIDGVAAASAHLKTATGDMQGLAKSIDGASASANAAARGVKHVANATAAASTHAETLKGAAGAVKGAFSSFGTATATLGAARWGEQVRGAQDTAKGVQNATQEVRRYADEVRGAGSTVNQLANQVLGLVAAHAGLKLLKGEFEAGSKGVHREVAMETSGMSTKDIAETQHRARELSGQFPTQDRSEIEGLITETRSIVGDMHEALEVQPDLLRLKTIAEAEHGGKAEGFANIVKGLEIAGVTQDMSKFRAYLNDMAQAMNVFKHTIRPEDYYQFFKYAGSQISRNLDRDYISGPAATIMQELRGSTAGFAHRAFVSEVFASRLSGKAAGQLDALGLVTDESKVDRKKDGSIKWLRPGAIEGSDLAIRNPMRWVHEVLDPAMSKKGLDARGRDEAVASIFENSNARQLVDILLNQKRRIDKDTALVRGAKGLEAADAWLTKDTATQGKALGAQWENLKRQSAEPAMPYANLGLNALRRGVEGFNTLTEHHPWVATGASAAAVAASMWAGWKGMQGGLKLFGGATGAAETAAGSGGGFLRGLGRGLLGTPGAAARGLAQGAGAAWAEIPADGQAALKAAGAGLAKTVGKGVVVGAAFEAGKYGLDKGLDALDRGLGVNQEPWRQALSDRARNRGLFGAARDLASGVGDLWAGRPYGMSTAQRENMPLSPEMQAYARDRQTPVAAAPAMTAWPTAGPAQASAADAARPEVDTTAIAAAQTKAQEAASAIQSLNQTASPQIDSASIDAATAKLRQLLALMGQIATGAAGLAASVGRSTNALHDGYETR